MVARKNFWQTLIMTILVIIIFGSTIVELITDLWWFKNLGYESIFLITIKSKLALFFIAGLLFLLFTSLNLWISTKLGKGSISLRTKILTASILSIFVGLISTNSWFTFLQYFNQTAFNIADPIFSKDVAFYVFSLPSMLAILRFSLFVLIITTILVTLDYAQSFISRFFKGIQVNILSGQKNVAPSFKDSALIHITALGSLIFILLGFSHYLSRFSIMFSEKGIVVGAGYTDVVAYLPIVKILMVLALAISILFFVWVFYIHKKPGLKKRHILMYALVLYVVLSFIGTSIIPGIIQTVRVSPNEINLEKEYIAYNIEFTKKAYGLDNVVERDFDVKPLTLAKVNSAKETIDNIRILDWRPLTQTYKQTQEIRLYYDLSNIDIDRYNINGKYTEVLLAPRELDQTQISANAQTWVNLHMVYTHGYGLVMSPVNSVTSQGLPNYLIQDVPPQYSVDEESLKIKTPEVYYGELENDYVLVNTDTQEFDFPQGNSNQYASYGGKGGVLLDTFIKKLLMAVRFGDIKILLSTDLNEKSRIMFDRGIRKRISKLVPFLALDEDPYLAIIDGRLLWVQDAYSVTNKYPYSQKAGGINYIRNSVKIVVDAYDGSITFYTQSEPLIDTYSKIFPGIFKSFDDMPESLKEHIRYPVDMFKVQSEIYNTYHMNDPTVFYNKEDAWQIPKEVYGVGQQMTVEPYYIIMRFPEEKKEEFVLMRSFTPIRKDNMVSWLAARSDGDNYGKLLLFKFPKDKLVYGPLQIEARIDQDSEISSQLTLWSQQGSRVTRGNLLVIPIGDSLLYIEPLYIQAEQGQLPELKRVILSDGENVVMEEDLKKALSSLFGKQPTEAIKAGDTSQELIGKASEYYNAIQEAIKSGDWAGIGTNLDNLGEVLDALKEK